MSSRVAASLELLITGVLLLGYFFFYSAREAFASHFLPLVWVPFILMLAVHKFIDRHQWTALRVARMILLERYGRIDSALAQDIQTVLIPNRVAPFMPLYQFLFVISFALLLFYQGWAIAILAFLVIFFLGFIISSVSAAIPAAGARADLRCLRAMQSCLERRLLVKPGDLVIPDVSRLELYRAVSDILTTQQPLQVQYFSALRAANQSSITS